MQASKDDTMPHPVPTKIIGKPTQKTIAILHAQLVANARSVHSDGGDGRLGHARIVLTDAEYTAFSNGNVQYITPPRPAAVVHSLNATTDTMYRTDKAYQLNLKTWKLHHDTEAKILQHILAAVDDKYTQSLKHSLLGYGNTNPLAVITHLITTYGQISSDYLLENREQLKQPWSPPEEIETFFHNIETCVAYSTKGNDTISTRNSVEAGVATLRQTGLFGPAIREWNRETLQNQTYDNFKIFFTDAERERQAETTVATAGYQRANQASAIPPTDDATATTAASSLTALTMADIQATIQAGIQTGIQAALAAQTNTNTNTNNTNRQPNNNRNNTNTNTNNRQRDQTNNYNRSIEGMSAARLAAMGYCWTHGFCHNNSHTSATCNRTNEGHRVEATGTNRMGGSNELFTPHSYRGNNGNN